MACGLDGQSAGKDGTDIFPCCHDLAKRSQDIQQSKALADFEHLRCEASYLNQKLRHHLVALVDDVDS